MSVEVKERPVGFAEREGFSSYVGFTPPVGVLQMFESYTATYNRSIRVYDVNWVAQTFTPSTNHKLSSVKVHGLKQGTPGTFTVSIRAVDGSGLPTGSDLSTGSVDPSGWTSYDYYEVSMSAYNLVAGTKYAIVMRMAGGDATNCILLRYYRYLGWGTPGYADGAKSESVDSGSTWTEQSSEDFNFEEYGYG